MVQYENTAGWSNTSYWKLEPLTETRIRTRKPEPPNKIGNVEPSFASIRELAVHSREQRNMLLYDRCTVDELQVFCTRRGLDIPSMAARTVNQKTALRIACTTRLEQHDDDGCTFEKLFDFPPEIRLRIYEWHRASLKTPPSLNSPLPVPPPITAVSRQVREETMPVFCGSLVFQCHGSSMAAGFKLSPTEMNVATQHFFDGAPEIHIRSLRQLKILAPLVVGLPETYAPQFSSRVRWRFDLRGRTRDSRVVCESSDELAARLLRNPREDVKQALIQKFEAIREALMDVADAISARVPFGLKREDADGIVEALNARPASETSDGSDSGFESSAEHD